VVKSQAEDFENLKPSTRQSMWGKQVDEVRQYILNQARKQNAISLLKKTAIGGAGIGLASEAYHLLK